MKRAVAILLFSFILYFTCYAQWSSFDKYYQDRIINDINLGKTLFDNNEKDSAIEYYLEAISIAEMRGHDYYSSFLVTNNGILEPSIEYYYSRDSIEHARHLVDLYYRFYDNWEKELDKSGAISHAEYMQYMRYYCSELMVITYNHSDYEYSAKYGEKYLSNAKSQGLLDEDYLSWHGHYILSLVFSHQYPEAFEQAKFLYKESKDLGKSDFESLQMIHSVRDFAMSDGGLYWFKEDVALQVDINNKWISFIQPLYDTIGKSRMDKTLMALDQKVSLRDELIVDATSSTLIASLLTRTCLVYISSGFDRAKEVLFDLKSQLIEKEELYLWPRLCVSFFEFLQSLQQHSAVYRFLKLIESDFADKDDIDLDDYLTYYIYYYGACDRVGDYGKALEICFTRFEDESIKISPLYWVIARLKGSFYISYLENFEKGLNSTLEALNLYRLPDNPRSGDYTLYAGLFGYVGDAYRRKGDPEKAIEYYNKDLEICREQNLKEQTLFPLFNLGRIYHSQKEYDKARECFLACAEIKSQSIDSYQKSAPYSYLFDIERTTGNTKKAREYLSLTWSSMLAEYLSYKDFLTIYEQTSYWRKQGAIDFIGGLIAESAPTYNDVYYDMLLTSKGFMQKAETREYLNVLYSKDARLQSLYNTVNSAETAPQTVIDEYMALYRKHSFAAEIATPSWKEVQNTLKKDEIAIEFFKYQIDDMYENPQYGALILKRGWDTPHFAHLCSEKDLKRALNVGSKVYKVSNVLYDLLWAPIQKEAKGVKTIYFSPHEILHTVNFAAIVDEKGRPLLETFDFHRLSSTYGICDKHDDSFSTSYVYGGLVYDTDDATMVSEHRKYNQVSSSVEWIADNSLTRSGWSYLPNTEREVSEVSNILSDSKISVTGYSGTSGTEESFKALNGKHPGHIHVATHGFYLKFAPADSAAIASSPEKRISSSLMALTRSGLILSNGGRAWKGESIPDGIDDGILQADEIAGLDLSGTSLLVLSACQTALGDISSDGVYGLQRAFKNAGVETIIMSLWEVDDKATFEFMTAFYRSLTKGRSKHDAFCEAQRQIKNNYEDPYYWAAFIMLD